MKKKSILFASFSILTLCFIFYNSLQTSVESSEVSNGIVAFLVNQFSQYNLSLDYQTLTVLVRKFAHITEFFLLGLFISLAYYFGKSKFSKRVVYVMFFGLLAACADEFLQAFVDGRGSLVVDVWIDFIGVIFAVLIYFIISASSGKHKI